MVSDEEFMAALKGLNMKVPDIAEKFSVSNNTIARWMVGENLPYNAVRESILKSLVPTVQNGN